MVRSFFSVFPGGCPLYKSCDIVGTFFYVLYVFIMENFNMKDAFYAATYKSSQVCTALNGTFDLGLDKKYYLPKELNKKIKKILN